MALDTVHNYYERLVFNEIRDLYGEDFDENQLADMACIALNRIAPRYIRYDIDMSFYMSTDEHIEVQKRVNKAVKRAYKIISESEPKHH
ncbi:MAG: hypothetical protein ISEC1_P1605 [Thiomicrorhabdus sp.]|nr:MAG: hypothetical protein ISEC1_P1605 [Thiomicrorhabdus sp.]